MRSVGLGCTCSNTSESKQGASFVGRVRCDQGRTTKFLGLRRRRANVDPVSLCRWVLITQEERRVHWPIDFRYQFWSTLHTVITHLIRSLGASTGRAEESSEEVTTANAEAHSKGKSAAEEPRSEAGQQNNEKKVRQLVTKHVKRDRRASESVN